MPTKTPEEGMKEAAKGMSKEDLTRELNRLNKMEERTHGQEVARKTMEQEWDKRNGGQS